YEPELSQQTADDAPLALDKLAEESAVVLAGENEEVFEDLLRLNGSSSGARPKIVAQVSTDKKRIIHGQQEFEPGFAHWMIKFPSSQDARDAGAIEYAYSLMAKDSGVEMSETHLFRTKRNKYFGTKRFDRDGDARIHMHSLGGLIHADHRSPSLERCPLGNGSGESSRRTRQYAREHSGRVKAGHRHDQSGHPSRGTGSRRRTATGMAPENKVAVTVPLRT
ncbi:MAG: HipA domain-containing protein, partial [Terracidiphilus sp.]